MQILVVKFKSVLNFQCTFWSKLSTKLLVMQVVEQKMLTDSSTNSCSFSTNVQRLLTEYRKSETITAGRQAKLFKATDKSNWSTNLVGNGELLLSDMNAWKKTKSSWNVFPTIFSTEDGESYWKHYLNLTQENLKVAWLTGNERERNPSIERKTILTGKKDRKHIKDQHKDEQKHNIAVMAALKIHKQSFKIGQKAETCRQVRVSRMEWHGHVGTKQETKVQN